MTSKKRPPLVTPQKVLEWGTNPYEFFNLNEQFEKEVQPLIDAVLDKCEALGIPLVMAHVSSFTKDGNTDVGTQGVFASVGKCSAELLAIAAMERGCGGDFKMKLDAIIAAQETKCKVTAALHPEAVAKIKERLKA